MKNTNGTILCMQCFHPNPHSGDGGQCTWREYDVICGCFCPERGVLTQEDELAALRKDALRYRFIKANGPYPTDDLFPDTWDTGITVGLATEGLPVSNAEQFEADLDAAMAEEAAKTIT